MKESTGNPLKLIAGKKTETFTGNNNKIIKFLFSHFCYHVSFMCYLGVNVIHKKSKRGMEHRKRSTLVLTVRIHVLFIDIFSMIVGWETWRTTVYKVKSREKMNVLSYVH